MNSPLEPDDHPDQSVLAQRIGEAPEDGSIFLDDEEYVSFSHSFPTSVQQPTEPDSYLLLSTEAGWEQVQYNSNSPTVPALISESQSELSDRPTETPASHRLLLSAWNSGTCRMIPLDLDYEASYPAAASDILSNISPQCLTSEFTPLPTWAEMRLIKKDFISNAREYELFFSKFPTAYNRQNKTRYWDFRKFSTDGGLTRQRALPWLSTKMNMIYSEIQQIEQTGSIRWSTLMSLSNADAIKFDQSLLNIYPKAYAESIATAEEMFDESVQYSLRSKRNLYNVLAVSSRIVAERSMKGTIGLDGEEVQVDIQLILELDCPPGIRYDDSPAFTSGSFCPDIQL